MNNIMKAIGIFRHSLWSRSVLILVMLSITKACLGATREASCDIQGSFVKATALLDNKNYKHASIILDQIRACQNLSPIDTFNLAWLYGRSHNFNTALNILRSVSPDIPNRVTHGYAIALTKFELGDFKGTVKTLTDLRSRATLDTRCINLLGVTYSKLGLYQDAYSQFAEELNRNPTSLFAYLNLVTLFSDIGQFQNALDVANKAVIALPDNSEVYVVRGTINMYIGHLEKADDDFANAIKMSPSLEEPRFLLALSSYKRGDFMSAQSQLKQAISSGIAGSDLHYLLAECLLKTDSANPHEAVVELDRAIDINPHSIPARNLRGRLLLEEGKDDRAIVDLKIVLQAKPNSRSGLYNLARAYSALGNKEKAKLLYTRLSKLEEDYHASTTNDDSLNDLSKQRMKEALTGGDAQ